MLSETTEKLRIKSINIYSINMIDEISIKNYSAFIILAACDNYVESVEV